MKIFEKRPLALILSIMMGGFSFFIDFDWKIKLIIASVSLLVISLIYIFDSLKQGRRPIIIISIVVFSISLLLSASWSLLFYPHSLYGSNATIKARVYEIDNSSSSTSVIVCKSEEIDGKRDQHTFIAYIDKEVANPVKKYDVILLSAKISEFSSYDDGFDGRTYYVSKGYSALLSDVKCIEVCENKIDYIDLFFDELNLRISNTLKLRTDFETGSFLAALIVGNRSSLSGNIRLNFTRLGISHILALSGMHLAILSLAINSILSKLMVKKKIRVAIMSVLIVFYMALTGFMSSVVRSGLMLMISGALYLLSKKSDALTSLVIAVFIIITVNPTSVYDMSLWLSAFATLGVVVFSDISEKNGKDRSIMKRLWVTLKNGCLVSVFAFCATFAFTALRFDYFSVASVFTTLIFSFIIQFFIYGGMLLLLIGGIIPFGKIMIVFSNGILLLAELISSIKFVYVSMNSLVVKLLIVLLTVFFFAFLNLEMKNKRRGVIIIVIMMLSVFVVAEIDTLSHAYKDEAAFAPSTAGDTFLIKSDGEITAIYSGKAFTDGGWEILDFFADESITYIDNLVFASYSYSTIDFANIIIDGIKVDRVLLPRPNTKEEINQSEGLSDLLSGYGTDVEFYEMLEYISFGEYKYRLFDKIDYYYGRYPSNVMEIVCDDERFTYLSVCEYEYLSPSAKSLLYNSENLIIGSIGNTNYYLFDMRIPEIQNIYCYDTGRLTEEAAEYYNKKGASVNYTKTPFSIFD